jgi:transcriptional regulator with XRE-family HTH domain
VTDEPVGERARRRLHELRVERGLTLEAVASRASIDVSTLSRLESGKRRLALDHLPALAAALGVTADDLLAPRQQRMADVRADEAGAAGDQNCHARTALGWRWPRSRSTEPRAPKGAAARQTARCGL